MAEELFSVVSAAPGSFHLPFAAAHAETAGLDAI